MDKVVLNLILSLDTHIVFTFFSLSVPGNNTNIYEYYYTSTDHNKGSHGNPGIYFKYDVSALKVVIREDRENLGSFLIRLCSVIAGIVVICGFINSIVQALFDRFVGHLLPQYKESNGYKDLDLNVNLSTSMARPTYGTGSSNNNSGVKTNLLLTNDMLQDNLKLTSNQFLQFK